MPPVPNPKKTIPSVNELSELDIITRNRAIAVKLLATQNKILSLIHI